MLESDGKGTLHNRKKRKNSQAEREAAEQRAA
jgi:hypothetical protein